MTCHAASHRGGSCRVSKGFTIIFLGWNIFWKIIFLDSLDLICGLLVSLLDVFYWRFLWSRLGFNSSNLISLDVKIMTAPGYNHFEQMRVYYLWELIQFPVKISMNRSNVNIVGLWKPIQKIDVFKMGAWGDRKLIFEVVPAISALPKLKFR